MFVRVHTVMYMIILHSLWPCTYLVINLRLVSYTYVHTQSSAKTRNKSPRLFSCVVASSNGFHCTKNVAIADLSANPVNGDVVSLAL